MRAAMSRHLLPLPLANSIPPIPPHLHLLSAKHAPSCRAVSFRTRTTKRNQRTRRVFIISVSTVLCCLISKLLLYAIVGQPGHDVVLKEAHHVTVYNRLLYADFILDLVARPNHFPVLMKFHRR